MRGTPWPNVGQGAGHTSGATRSHVSAPGVRAERGGRLLLDGEDLATHRVAVWVDVGLLC